MKNYPRLIVGILATAFSFFVVSCGEPEKIDANEVEPIGESVEPLPEGEGNVMPDKSLFDKADEAAQSN